MQGEDPRRVVDLGRYRKARKAEAVRVPKAPAPQGVLGSRRGAGLILVLIVAGLIAVCLIPHLH